MKTPNLAASLVFLVLSLTASAADTGAMTPEFAPVILHNTQLRPLPRAANGRDYLLYVAMPPDYATSGRSYPVLYLCDGYWDFTLINGFYGNLLYDQVAPDFIIVGLGYQHASTNGEFDVLRRYDYSPAPDRTDPQGRLSGHAAEFLGVVEHEIIPFVEREYRADPAYRVLSGNSLGGLFSLYALFVRPGLFQAHIAVSPATPDWLFDCEKQFAASGRKLPARLFLTGAEKEWPDFLASIKRFNERLQSRHYEGLTYQWRLIDGEGHTGTKAESYSRGLRFAFAPLVPKS